MAAKKNAAHFGPGSKEYQNRLDQLFQVDGPEADRESVLIDRDLIDPDPNQPRRYFDPIALKKLGESIRTVGQLHAVLLRPHPTKEGRYMLVVGERRWRSTDPDFDLELGPAPKLKAVVKKLTDFEVTRIQIEENDKREDVSPIAVARGYKRLYDMLFSKESGKNVKRWKRIAEEVGVAERTLHRFVKLLDLPAEMQTALEVNELTAKHGQALTDLDKWPKLQKVLFRQIIKQEISGNEALRRSKDMKPTDVGTRPAVSASGSGVSPEETKENPLKSPLAKGDLGGFSTGSTPSPATTGTGMEQSTEPVRKPPLPERREALRKSLIHAHERLIEASVVIPDLAGARRFQDDIEEVLYEMTKSIREIRKGLK